MKKILVIGIILFGLALRLYPFFKQEFFFDERFTYYYASKINFITQIVKPADDRPPLYYIIEKAIIVFSKSHFVLRAPSLIFAILAMFFIYKIFELFLKEISLYTLLLSAVNPLLIHISWQARDYSMLFFLVVLTIYFSIKNRLYLANHKRLQIKNLGQFIIVIVLGTLTSYLYYPFIFAVLIALAISFLKDKKILEIIKRNKQYISKLIFWLTLAIVLATYYLSTSTNEIVSRNSSLHQGIGNEAIEETTSELFLLNSFYWKTGSFKLLSLLVVVLLIIPIFFVLSKKESEKIKLVVHFLYIQTILCLLIYFLISKFYLNLIITRGFLPITIFPIFIISFFIYQINEKSKKNYKKLIELLLFLILLAIGMIQYLERYQILKNINDKKSDWAYPSTTDQPMTKLSKIMSNYTAENAAILFWPEYIDIIFEYESDKNQKSNFSFNKYFYLKYEDKDQNINKIISNYKNLPKKLVIVYDSYAYENKTDNLVIKMDNFIKNNCLRTNTVEVEFYYKITECDLR